MSESHKRKLAMSLDEINAMEKRSNQRRRYNNRPTFRPRYANYPNTSSRDYNQRRRFTTNRYQNEGYNRNRFSQRRYISQPNQRFRNRRRSFDKPRYRKKINNSDNKQNEDNRTRLFVSNLHSSIVNNELKKIFENIGPLKRCGIRWDKLGHSLGTADVEYDSPLDAAKAIKCFNNAEIEGTIMKVEYNVETKSKQKRRTFKKRLGFRARVPSKQQMIVDE